MSLIKPEINNCPICYETIGHNNNYTTECGHNFCFECISTAYQRNHKCPLCRANYKCPKSQGGEIKPIRCDNFGTDGDGYNVRPNLGENQLSIGIPQQQRLIRVYPVNYNILARMSGLGGIQYTN
jgi:hypothetical protein